ncbi:MAG TPA: hypothetical protein VLI07_17250 [Candidatus Binatus sp.]|nr:hypothetical protein [Candidatus Binatus sp.]
MRAVSQAVMVVHEPVTGTPMVVVVVLGLVVVVMCALVVVVKRGLVVVGYITIVEVVAADVAPASRTTAAQEGRRESHNRPANFRDRISAPPCPGGRYAHAAPWQL